MEKDWKRFVKERYEEYKKIGYVECPAFGGERVYFTQEGFDHLLMKKGKLRKRSEQMRKIHLFEHASLIIQKTLQYSGYIKNIRTKNKGLPGSVAEFWELRKKMDEKFVYVIIRRINDGPKHFFSVKDRKHNEKDP